jgi:D-aminoacyl-tRNA deacylase
MLRGWDMRAVVQRVRRAEVRLQEDGAVLGSVGRGLVVLLGIGAGDTRDDAGWLAAKVADLRVFPDEGKELDGGMSRSVRDVGGGILLVSQFTLYGDCRKGRRPSFTDAMAPGPAEALYGEAAALFRATGVPVQEGRFRAMMDVALENDGPVTLLLDSRPEKP